MSDFVSFNPAEIQKVGLVCNNCGTEILLEFSEKKIRVPQSCPACDSAPPQPPFSYKFSWRWFEEIDKMRRSDEASLVRFYFKEK